MSPTLNANLYQSKEYVLRLLCAVGVKKEAFQLQLEHIVSERRRHHPIDVEKLK
jgi:hypothetical protein